MTQANPAKKKGNPKLGEMAKQRAEYARVMKEKMAEFGAETPEELFAKMAVAANDDLVVTVDESTVSEPTPVQDCLHYITEDTPYVPIVSTYSTITLRPAHAKATPPIQAITLSDPEQGEWAFCPFHIGDRTSEENDQRMKLMKRRWWMHVLTRETAERIYDDERWRKPTHAVIDPKEFKGYDTLARAARGDNVKIEKFIPLREVTRIVLQRLSETFLDYGRRPPGFDFDPRFPNPYRNKIAGLRMKTHTPKATQADYNWKGPTHE